MDCYRKLLGGKIHRATVTHADVDYEGSITIPPELMSAAGLVAHESVHVWDITNGNRFETYTIEGREGTGDISVNGAATHLVSLGDIIIIAYFKSVHESEIRGYEPTVVFVDERNRMKTRRHEIAGPQRLQAVDP